VKLLECYKIEHKLIFQYNRSLKHLILRNIENICGRYSHFQCFKHDCPGTVSLLKFYEQLVSKFEGFTVESNTASIALSACGGEVSNKQQESLEVKCFRLQL
jgi:hypothetical protein